MAKAAKKNEVAPTGGAAPLPAHMQGKQGKGMEHIDQDDLELPRISLLQAISPEVVDDHHAPGQFFHNIAEMELGDKLRVVPIHISKSFILWRPRHEGGGILARAADGVNWDKPDAEFEVHPFKDTPKLKVTWKTAETVKESGLDAWGSTNPDDEDSPPAATKMFNVVCHLPDYPGLSPAVITLQRASVKVANKLMSALMISEAPIFGTQFNCLAVADTNNAGQDFLNYKFKMDGFVEDEELFNKLEKLHEQFESMGVKIKDEEGLQGGGEDAAPADDGKGKF